MIPRHGFHSFLVNYPDRNFTAMIKNKYKYKSDVILSFDTWNDMKHDLISVTCRSFNYLTNLTQPIIQNKSAAPFSFSLWYNINIFSKLLAVVYFRKCIPPPSSYRSPLIQSSSVREDTFFAASMWEAAKKYFLKEVRGRGVKGLPVRK